MEYVLYWLILAFCTGLIFNLRMDKVNAEQGGVQKAFIKYMAKDGEFWDATGHHLKVLYRWVFWGFCLVVWPLMLYYVLHSYFKPEEYVV